MLGAPKIESGSLVKWTIYSFGAHIATSFVPAAIVVKEDIADHIQRFQECEKADLRGARVRLVVSSSCTVIRCKFLGRTIRMVVR
jgi:hypothetical protein